MAKSAVYAKAKRVAGRVRSVDKTNFGVIFTAFMVVIPLAMLPGIMLDVACRRAYKKGFEDGQKAVKRGSDEVR